MTTPPVLPVVSTHSPPCDPNALIIIVNPSMPPQAKRRRRQSSVLSFFQPDPPTPPSLSPAPSSIPSPPSATTASPVKPSSVLTDIPISEPTTPPVLDREFTVCALSRVCVDVVPSPQVLAVCALPGVDLSAVVGSPVTPDDVKDQRIEETDDEESDVDQIEEVPGSDDEDDWQPVSRFARSRNIARRSARLRAATNRENGASQSRESTPDDLTTPTSSPDRSTEAETTRLVKFQPPSPKRKKLHPFFTPKDGDNAKPTQQKKLHPFFAATVAAVSNARERKRPRPVIASEDAWHCPFATIHVNALKTLGTFPVKAGTTEPVRQPCSVEPVEFSRYTGKAGLELRPVESVPCENADTWAERYKRDRRIDVINGAATKELVDWLRNWYETRQMTEVSDDSQDSYVMPNEIGDRDRVAIVIGPVGCGKSTMISNASRQLGLSILEINASVCRTGKKIREVIGDALSTHRVTHRSAFQTFKPKVEPVAKTLILFEEVDELHDDEKGFWSTIQKLAASSDCRRPIVCTANSFTAQMRQFFVESKAVVDEDMDRLLVNSRVEQLVNPIAYKLIELQSRSERQAAAVINRVCSTEAAEAVNDVANCLALTCRNDTRKAINLVQFWGARGLVHESASSPRRTRGSPPKRIRHGRLSEESQGRIGTELIEAVIPGNHAISAFHVGSLNYISSRSKKQNSPSKSNDSVQCDEVLDAWCTSLEAMSYADVIDGTVKRALSSRSFGLSEESFDTCMHTDVHQAAVIAREIDSVSLQCSECFLRFTRGAQHVSEMAKEAAKDRSESRNHISRHLPVPRRPVSLEYMPILRTMATAEEKPCNGPGCNTDGPDRPMRRTRARSRQGGVYSLDVDPITILALKKSAITTNES